MARPAPAVPRRTAPPRQPAATILAIVVGATALYLARAVLVPIALAILLTFMVHPIVQRLTRWGLGRAMSVATVVGVLVLSLGGVAWILAVEFGSLSTQMPVYRDNLITKIGEARRLGRGGVLDRVQSAATDVARELQKDTAAPAPPRDTPTPVVVRSEPGGLWQLPSLVEALGGAGMVLALVIFMLIEREDLRNRLIRLGGYGRLATTTRALDETAQRISRYLLTQSIINAGLGAAIALGLLLLGVPFAPLWGFLAAALRFIPYVGVWLAGLLLVVFSLAAYPSWHQALLVAGLFVLLELGCSFALEPLLYGQSAGVSQVALLCSIAFWAWLWGPIGLLLATPLTVCLVVFARHVPGMEFVGILMADAPPIAPPAAYYQRLLAMDRAEAARIVSEYAKDRPPETVYDDLILPALAHARRDRRHGLVPEEVERYIWATTGELVDELHARRGSAAAGGEADACRGPSRPRARLPGPRRGRPAGPRDAPAPGGPGPLGDRALLAPAPGLRGDRARRGDAAGSGLHRGPAREPRGHPHALPVQAPARPLPRSAHHRRTVGPARSGGVGAATPRGGGRRPRRAHPGRDARAPAAGLRARAARRRGRGQDLGGPSSSSSRAGSTGFVTCRSKPAASARRRSSSWPYPVTATSRRSRVSACRRISRATA